MSISFIVTRDTGSGRIELEPETGEPVAKYSLCEKDEENILKVGKKPNQAFFSIVLIFKWRKNAVYS